MSYLQRLAAMLGVGSHQAEDVLHSESAARAVLTRRNLFAAGAAMVAGSAFSFGEPAKSLVLVPTALTWESIQISFGDGRSWMLGALPQLASDDGEVRLAGPLGTTVSVSPRALVQPGERYHLDIDCVLPIPCALRRLPR